MTLDLDDVLSRLEADPTNVVLLDELVEAQMDRGHPEDATQHLWRGADLLVKSGDGKGAFHVLEHLVHLDSDATRNLAALALGALRAVLPHSKPIVELVAGHFTRTRDQQGLLDWAMGLGRLVRDKKDFADALVEPLAGTGATIDSLQQLGALYERLDDPARAARWYARVAERHADAGNFTKAVSLFKQVLDLDRTQHRVHLRLGQLHHGLGELSEAESHLRKAETEASRAGDSEGATTARRLLQQLHAPTA